MKHHSQRQCCWCWLDALVQRELVADHISQRREAGKQTSRGWLSYQQQARQAQEQTDWAHHCRRVGRRLCSLCGIALTIGAEYRIVDLFSILEEFLCTAT